MQLLGENNERKKSPKKEYSIIAKKVRASADEVAQNRRSKSAIMRCLERI